MNTHATPKFQILVTYDRLRIEGAARFQQLREQEDRLAAERAAFEAYYKLELLELAERARAAQVPLVETACKLALSVHFGHD